MQSYENTLEIRNPDITYSFLVFDKGTLFI